MNASFASMDFNPMLPLLGLIVFIRLVAFSSLSAFPIAKPFCPDHCGDVSIPYPFGIQEGCYLKEPNSSFLLECNPPRRPRFGNSTDIIDISLQGQLRILNKVAYDCYERNVSTVNSTVSVDVRPFVFNSTANKFTAIGCDTISLVEGFRSSSDHAYYTGCNTFCDDSKEGIMNNSCSGAGCCQTSIALGSWQIQIVLGSPFKYIGVSSFSSCGYGFLVETNAFHFFADNLTNFGPNETLPVVVDWVIANQTCEEAQKNLSSYACGQNAKCYYVEQGNLGYRCMCNEGYRGNPYLPTSGCQDVDECQNPEDHHCPKHSTCVNTAGTYLCNCTPGYHHDADNSNICVADQKPDKKTNLVIYLVVALGIGAVILLGSSSCFFELMKRKEKRIREEFFRKNGGLILQQKLTAQGGGVYSARIFTKAELQKATNDFDETQIIGCGGCGTVFRGELMDKKVVAVKKSREVDEHQKEQFINEVTLLSQINSRNVVKLLGCCLETEVPLLVYEYINNGTLFEHLHDKAKASKLSWNIRLRIASEIAGVLSYLHSVASPPIIHRDIKSANILLDQNYTAKVSDFGISRFVSLDDDQVATMVQGTLGYLDPEYMQTGVLTEKSDVYSFGIVLMELITGRKVLASKKLEAEKFLSNTFLSCLKENHLDQVLDINISCDENFEQLKEVALIAKRCISVRGEDRPCIRDVERELEMLGKKAEQISIQVFESDSSKGEVSVSLQSIRLDSCDDLVSSGQFSLFYTTPEQPLLTISGGR